MRRSLLALAAAVLLSAAAAGEAAAATTYTYVRGAAVYATGTSRLTPVGVFIDDDVYRMSTTSTGVARLPWPVKVYGTSYSSLWVSTNGNVQFGTSSPSRSWSNTCLAASLPGRVVLPYWDDIKYEASNEGIFTKAYTEGGVQRFLISWRGRHFGTDEPIRAEVIFSRGSNNFEYRYADGFGGSATIGAQRSPSGPATQVTCNSGRNVVDAGLRLSFRYV